MKHRLGQWLIWHGWWVTRFFLFRYLWRGHTFRVFKPAWITRMFDPSIEPWSL
jgi:hypothetical protein